MMLFVMKIWKIYFLSKIGMFWTFLRKNKSSFVICYDYIFTSRSTLPLFHSRFLFRKIFEIFEPKFRPSEWKVSKFMANPKIWTRAKNNIWTKTHSQRAQKFQKWTFLTKNDFICRKNMRLEVRKESDSI